MSHSSDDRADVRDMLVIHEAFRQSYRRMPELVMGVAPGDVDRAAIVADHIQLMEQFLHLHHKGRDDLLWPKLLDRASERLGPAVALLERRHAEIATLMTDASVRLAAWRRKPSAVYGTELADSLEKLGTRLAEHLATEERDVLPLVPDYVTAEEWHELGDHAIKGLPKNKLPIIFGMLASLAEPEVVTLMLSAVPLVPRLIMPLLGPRAYARHAQRVYERSQPPDAWTAGFFNAQSDAA
ncbi:hemerythrin domain-containing protein [Planotetraspora sp. A-T 1434]|uniref:hemerythrin domain-containing protein n=1 Tax=Planotetraspora sp. A-T 1434 TaxID=2979219 RepID=UPI0021C0FE15|nr:hemerythrin domain-containing protein [Planotetraspora sp. A-T 1434]MCT9931853.1 hemerythrin domain-containing protein [Planotetraspora sp. A-T 1434]